MEPDATRIEGIEHRLAGLERRVRQLERAASADSQADVDLARARGAEPRALRRPIAAQPPRQSRADAGPPPAPRPRQAGVAAKSSGGREPSRALWGPANASLTAATPAPPAAIEASQSTAESMQAPPPQSAGQEWMKVPAAPGLGWRDIEEQFAGRALAWVGGIALIAAAVFFLSLAFSRGWITEPMRVLIGLLAGAGGLVGGAVLLERRNALLGNVLSGVGLGIVSIALLAATRLYAIVGPEVGLAGALAAAVVAAVIAVRYDARSVAAYGLVAALIAPPLVGASPDLLTLLFVATTLVGTTAISLFRSWRWLPQIAFVLAAPQLASWIVGDPDTAQAVIALAAFWLVNLVAAAGEEVHLRRDDLRPSSATLVLANAAFLLWGLLTVLRGPAEAFEGLAVAMASVAHLAVGAWFLRRQGLQHLFGNLVAGTGVALLAIASFIQLGAPAVPVAWAAEAVALAWLAARRRHTWSALASVVLGGLALAHLVIVEYPLWQASIPASAPFEPPLLHPAGGTLLAILLALLVTGVVVRVRRVRSLLAATAVIVSAYVALFEFAGPLLAAVLVLIGVTALVMDQVIGMSIDDPRLADILDGVPVSRASSIAAIVPGALAVVLLLSAELPMSDLGATAASPFLNAGFASLLIVLGGLLAAGALIRERIVRSGFGAIGLLLFAWGLAFQLSGVPLVGALALLLPAGIVVDIGLFRLWSRDNPAGPAWPAPEWLTAAAGVIAWGAGSLLAMATFAPPASLGRVRPPAIPFTDEAAIAAAFLVAGGCLAIGLLTVRAARRAALLAATAVAAYVIPFEVYADGVVVLWVALALLLLAAARWDAAGEMIYTVVGGLLWMGGVIVTFGIVAPPSRLAVDGSSAVAVPLLAGWPLAFAALAAGAWVAPRSRELARARHQLQAVAAAVALYGVSVGIVDIFARQVGGGTPAGELAIQAQVALSVCWTAIGAVTLAAGFARRMPRLRHAGLLLLGVATAKVFLVDLASMDVAYRAIVLAGLGVLLLVSAWFATRSHGPRSGRSGLPGGAGTAA